ncbi:nuclear pore complex protein NUP1-like [Olea europaea var. sylvestris]|uniref:nuclear pore complex protein NUP1-like n=1 Tax=Olea europaea var. sylvestris TaxID=158386 RepID=UPI000C1D23FB|nr:nuclear pore complex protein NUP1-like [Olea europaea var. sylvestris]
MCSSVNVLSHALGGQQIIAKPNEGGDQNTQKDGSTFGKYETVPSVASNGSFVSSPPAFSYAPSTSIANFMPSFTAASSSCHFGSNLSPSPLIKFGISEDQSTAVLASSTTNASEPTVFQSKAESSSVFGGLININSSISSFAASSGSNTFRLGSSLASSMANGQSQSLLGAASGFLTSSVGIVSQSTPIQSGTYASLSSFNISSSTSLVSSSFSSQALSPNGTLGFSSSLVPSSATNGIGSGNGPTSSLFKFVGSSSGVNVVSSSSGATGLSSFGPSSSSSGTNTVGSSSGASSGIFSFSGSSSTYNPGTNAASNSTSTSGIFKFGGNSLASSMFTTSTSLTGFSFGASSSSFATNAAPMVLNSSSGSSSSLKVFSFSAAPAAASSPVFGNPSSPFANHNQINTEDSMIEDSVQSPSLPVSGQPSASPSPPAVMFGLASTSQAIPFQLGSQPNQVAQQNPSPFQASTSLEHNAGGGFSLGSGGGGDKSGRRIVKVNRNKHRKK